MNRAEPCPAPEFCMNRPTDPASFAIPGRTWSPRVEDEALVRGQGRYTDDHRPGEAARAAFVRSPHAFATIRSIDAAAALEMPGVLAVITAADMAAAHYHSISHPHPLPGRGGKMVFGPHRPALADGRVLHVGEPVALVVAETQA